MAYEMCSGESSALPNTHPTLSATLVIPSTGSGIIIATPPAAALSSFTRTANSDSTSVPTTLLTTSSTIGTFSIAPSTTKTSTTLSTQSTSVTTTSATPPVTTTAPSSIAASSNTLGTAQIAGISVGVAGAIGVALGAILLARCVRRRKFPDFSQDGFSQMDEGQNRGPSGIGGAAARLTKIFHISPPILKGSAQQKPETPLPPTLAEAYNFDGDTIGLAISRPRSEITISQEPPPVLERKPSKLLPPRPLQPAKPNLTLNIPSLIHPALRPDSSQPPQTDRTSTMTNMTAFADLDVEAPENGQIWRPPSSNPQSAVPYYVVDKWGNWVLSNNARQSDLAMVTEAAELDTYTPLTKSPIEKQEEEMAKAMAGAMSGAYSPFPFKPQPAYRKKGTVSRSSSFYSQASAPRPMGRASRGSIPTIPRRPSRSDSMGSTTTINTSSSSGEGPFDDEPPAAPQAQDRMSSALSPVRESPSPGTGRSPVSYPRIPGRFDGSTIRLVPPPKRPDFTSASAVQPSPTLGAPVLSPGSPSNYPRPLNLKRALPPGQPTWGPDNLQQRQQIMTSGSGFSPERPTAASVSQQHPLRQVMVRPDPTQSSSTSTSSDPPQPPPRSELRLSKQQFQQPHRQQQQQRAYQSPPPQPPRLDTRSAVAAAAQAITTTANLEAAERYRPQKVPSFISPVSATTTSSAASSLLAKRVGTERAAGMSLFEGGAAGRMGGKNWMRGPPAGGGAGPGSLLSPEMALSPRGPGGLPATPTWQPKLTPTRRGDDLFLNVQ
ncbi:hypothetical protein BX600DRAFT_537666 [Xylariales sp. PMI_506]|nr:hypothetical protein BX600DRAFT_537666 [Xylariales sp. PMI_506]